MGNSRLEDLPQEVLVKVLCGVEHRDCKSLFYVSHKIREVAILAKEYHFDYTTPRSFHSSFEFQAPKKSIGACSRLNRKELAKALLVKFVLMSVENWLPLKVIKGMLWYLGLPDDYLRGGLGECFEVVEIGDGLKGLTVVKSEKILSVIQKNMLRSGVYSGGEMEAILIPLYPSKGLRLRTKILDWSDGFQKLSYVSPYEKWPDLYPDSDVAEKRVVVYLLNMRNNMCTAILKEAYFDETAIEAHPLAEVKKKYILLVKESKVILKKGNSKMELDGGDTHDGRSLKSVYKLP
ncbi:protein root primordium defective 1 [Tanacetum coccineum]